jgi:hypothetical protein
MREHELQKKVAVLESMNDQLQTEISYLDELMRMVGFSEGLAAVKAAAREIKEYGPDESESE